MNPITQIRSATEFDADCIGAIQVAGWRAAYAGIVPEAYLAAMSVERSAAMWRAHIQRAQSDLLVAMLGEAMLGWICCGRSRDPGAAPTMAEIWAFYVDPTHWRRGIGRRLVTAAFSRLREAGFQEVSLWALSGNRSGIDFYRAQGFELLAGARKSFELGGAQLDECGLVRSLAGLRPEDGQTV